MLLLCLMTVLILSPNQSRNEVNIYDFRPFYKASFADTVCTLAVEAADAEILDF